MSIYIEKSFIKQFEADVSLAYQQKGTKLKPTVRIKDNIRGSSCVFNKVSKGTASEKARHALIPTMNTDHQTVECILHDYYAGDWVDSLDELKTNIDERQVIASTGAYALGRKSDELIIQELNKTNLVVDSENKGLTKDKIFHAIELLNGNDVPDDGYRFAIIGVHQFSELLNMKEFTSSEYIGDKFPLLDGAMVRKWMGINWILHTGLPMTNNNRSCFIYYKNAVGYASNGDIETDISWSGERAAHFISNRIGQGATLIDDSAVIKIICNDTSEIK